MDKDVPNRKPRRAWLGGVALIAALGAIVATSLLTREPSESRSTFCTLQGIVGPAVNSTDHGLVIVVDAAEHREILNGCPHGLGDASLTPDCRLWDGATQVGTLEPAQCAEFKSRAR